MPFKFFEFLEQFMPAVCLITLTQTKKNGSKEKVFIPKAI